MTNVHSSLQNPLGVHLMVAGYIFSDVNSRDLPEGMESLPPELTAHIPFSSWAGANEIPMYHHGQSFESDAWLNNPNNGCAAYSACVRARMTSKTQKDIEALHKVFENKGYECEYTPENPEGKYGYERAELSIKLPVDFSGLKTVRTIDRCPRKNPTLRDVLPHTWVSQLSGRFKMAMRKVESDLEEATGLEISESIHVRDPQLRHPTIDRALAGTFVAAVADFMGISVDYYRTKGSSSGEYNSIYFDAGDDTDRLKVLAPFVEEVKKSTGVEMSLALFGITIHSEHGPKGAEAAIKEMTKSLKSVSPQLSAKSPCSISAPDNASPQ